MTTVAVTGATGFLGRHLLGALAATRPDRLFVVIQPGEPPLQDIECLTELEPADTVFHLAGGAGVQASLEDPARDLDSNVGTLLGVLRAARTGAIGRIVLASSAAVYGPAEGLVDERHPCRPVSPYGISKRAAEEYARVYAELYRVDTVVARIGNVYGPGQRRLVVYDLARRALTEGRPLRVHGDGAEVRDFVHASDVAGALLLLGERGERAGIYNIGSGAGTTIRDLAEMIAAAAGFEPGGIETTHVASDGKVKVFRPAIERISALGYRAKIPLASGVQETVEWVRHELGR